VGGSGGGNTEMHKYRNEQCGALSFWSCGRREVDVLIVVFWVFSSVCCIYIHIILDMFSDM
jgi:hypothetical protein